MKSIRTKIICFLGGVVLVAMLISVGATMVMQKNVSVEENTDIALMNAKVASDAVDEYVMKYKNITDTLASNYAIRDMLTADTNRTNYTSSVDYADIYNTLSAITKADSNILSTYIAKVGTDLSFDGGDWLCDPGFDVTTRSYWFNTDEDLQKGYIITSPYEDVDTGKIVFTVSMPVYAINQDVLVGVVAIDITIDEACKKVLSIKTPYDDKKSAITLVSADDTILASKDAELVLKQFKETGLSEKFLLNGVDKQEYSAKAKKGGKTYYVNTNKSEFTGWKTVFEIEESEFLSETNYILARVMTMNAFIFVILTVLFLIFANRIVRPIKQLNGMAKAIAAGDLDTVIRVKGQDEIAQLADSLWELVARLKENLLYIAEICNNLERFAQGYLKLELKESYEGEFANIKTALQNVSDIFTNTIGDIINTSTLVATASGEISNTAQVIARGATTQASTTEQLVATINELTKNVEINANNAVASSEQVKQVGEVAAESNVQMKEMMEAIGEINDKSSEIGKIIKVIEDIAFQTNILALNAAVEAARAGEAGKGFAVVADEVRNLASKSAEAAKDTTSLIEETVRAVANGTTIANRTGEKLEEVIEGVTQTVDLIDEISRATVAESETLKSILTGVEDISSVVQTNAANVQETSAASEELSLQADGLDKVVKRFKID